MRRARTPGAVLLALLVVGLVSWADAATSAPSTTGCTTARPVIRKPAHLKPPRSLLDSQRVYRVLVDTNCGSFTIELDTTDSPKASASFVALARTGFYDRTAFYRITSTYIQGGDPTGTGSGGAGYTTVDPPPSGAVFTRGVVAMSQGSNEPAGTGSSQFFILTGSQSQRLRNALLGKIVAGQPTIARISKLATAGGRPKSPVVVLGMKVTSHAAPAPKPGECLNVSKPPAKRNGGQSLPTSALDRAKTYDAIVSTSCGTFTIRLDVKHSPKTTASFVSLARRHFFDKTVFHRIVPGFVIQGGDPLGNGQGGAGYDIVEAPPSSTHYTLGVAAMAKAPSAPSGDSSSQFFIVTAADAGLPPIYALLGKVVSGLAVVEHIGKLGNPSTQAPTKVIVVNRVTIAVR
jgi:peptidyl-prolyl cis-trans isomerase B (cyclophilin B)